MLVEMRFGRHLFPLPSASVWLYQLAERHFEFIPLWGFFVFLSVALHATIPTPAPYVATTSVVTGAPEVRPVSAPIPEVSLPPALAAVSTVIGKLDAATGLLAAIAQSRDLTDRHRALARARVGMSPTLPGVFETLKQFDHCGSHFAPGALVSRDLIPDGVLHRLVTGRVIGLIDASVASAA